MQGWNLSYTCLTSFDMRQALRNIKDTNPDFWNELTIKRPEDLPLLDETKITPEDESLLTAELEDEDLDDSEVPMKAMIASLDTTGNKLPKGIAPCEGGSLMTVHAAESLDETLSQSSGTSETSTQTAMPERLGPGK